MFSACVQASSYDDFFRAIELDDVSTVNRLLARGFDPNTPDAKGQVALYVALRAGSEKVAQALASHPELKVDATNAAEETPLMMAALRGALEPAQRLLTRGAAVNRPGWTPLHYAASGPNPALVRVLLERGASVDARSPNGSTPLMMAARYGSEDAVALLLERGADASARNQLDLGPADFARAVGRESLAKRLESLARR
jgi:ankyrin repeat protein